MMEGQAKDTNPKIEYPKDWQDAILDEMVANSRFYSRDRFKVIEFKKCRIILR